MTQDAAFNILTTGGNVFLTGEPGSGKSHMVNRYVAYLRAHDIEPSVTASTGIAATHIGGMTIHSWSGIGIKRTLTPQELDELSTRESLVRRVTNAKVLIIDEISMLDGQVLVLIEKVLRILRQSSEPFGGLQIVFVGDFFQLPPIVRHGEPPAQFCFNSPAWQSANPIICYLSEQHRQEDAGYLSVLGAIRHNTIEGDTIALLSSRCIDTSDAAEGITQLFTHNADVDRINEEELGKLDQESRVFAMETAGRQGLVEQLKRGILSPESLNLKIGARVMFTKNNFEAGYVNGTMGTIVGFDEDDSGYPKVETHKGDEITAIPYDWTIEDNGKVLAKATQVPLRLAWAMSVHKSQGMSMDSAVIDLSRAFEYGQGYVALSRVRTQKGLYLLGFNERALEIHPEILANDSLFRERSDEAERAFANIPKEELTVMHHNFIKRSGGKVEEDTEKKKKPQIGSTAAKTAYTEKLAKLRETFPNAYRPWGEDEEKKLLQMFKDNSSQADIAKALGRKKNAIRSRLVRLGLIEE